MTFTCTKCGKAFVKLGGWKRHMSKEHGGYDERDIADVTSGDSTSSEADVRARMEAFAASLSRGESTGGEESARTESQAETKTTPPAPSAPPVKTVKASPRKLKKVLAAIPQTLLENAGLTLDEEDKEALEEAGEFLSDIFGVEFEVDQSKHVLHSRFWAIVWVAGVAALIYCKHKFSDVWAKIYEVYKKKLAEQEKAA